MKLSRRGFVKFSAGSAAGLGLAGFSLKALSALNATVAEEIYPPRGPESFGNSICQLCPGGCGITVRKVGARAVSVTGNKSSPINSGGLCPIGVASLQYLYHPERLRSPLKKQGNSWSKISWKQAVDEITSRLRSLAERGESERVAVLSHPLSGVLKESVSKLLRGLGSRDLIELSGPGDGTQVAVRIMQGVTEAPAYDLASSNYILTIGCEILEGWTSPVWDMKGFSQFRGKRPRGRLVYAGPRQSVTAAKADSWIPLRPGSGGAFALGIAYVLISERLYDFEFVHSQCFGFEDWRDSEGKLHAGFRSRVLDGYPLNRVSELTGVAPEQILRVAREFGSTRPALALAGSVESVSPNSVMTALCVHSLNALSGSIDRRGGVLLQYPDPLKTEEKLIAEFPPLMTDFKARLRFGEDPLQVLDQALQRREPYLPSALLLLETDPVFDSREPEDFGKRLRQIPLIVSISSLLNATSSLADYVLPAATFLESWVEQPAPPGVPFSYEGLSAPALEPIGESRSVGDIVLTLARALAVKVPEGDYGSAVKNRLARLYEEKRGSVAGTVFDQLWQQLMEQSGWWAPTYETPDQLLQQMETKGGWWDSFYRYEDWSRSLRTSSGKFQFYLPEAEFLRDSNSAPGDSFYFPHFESPPKPPGGDAYPFLVNFFDPLAAKTRQSALPLVREIAGGQVQNNIGVWVELGQEDAGRLGVRSGDLVWVESPRSRIQAFARTSTSVPAGLVNIPRGLGGKNGPWNVISTPGGASLVEQGKANEPTVRWTETRVRITRA
ncbi:MAG: molybdopterin-dependent oxidoreductase [Acidobacteria bacterium]|nr:molybdopterin-dependent oxidoreductase [Acidobacteriota bacterium]